MSTNNPRGLRAGLLLLVAALSAVSMLAPASAVSADPTGALRGPSVTGPIAGDTPGDPSRNYPFGSSVTDLKSRGYVEEEFFFSGVTAGGPYTSRMIVRRPKDPARFSGNVLAEWTNVSLLHDVDCFWTRSSSQFMRTGDAYVTIDAQTEGVNNPSTGLKAWNPKRYAPLHIPTSGYFVAEAGAYEIFGQALKALRTPGATAPLGKQRVERLYATGCSQSSAALSLYASGLGLAHNLVDGYLSVVLSTNTTNYPGETTYPAIGPAATNVPFLQLNSESDRAKNAPADSETYRLWEVAGAVHHDADAQAYVDRLVRRDFGRAPADPGCKLPPWSRIPLRNAQAAAYERLKQWVETKTPPSSQPRLAYESDGSVSQNRQGLALGGIRLPEIAVPLADNGAENDGPDIGCTNFYGHHLPFSKRQVRSLYPTHRAFVAAFEKAANRAVRAGVLLPADARTSVARARSTQTRQLWTGRLN